MKTRILVGDCRERLKELPDESVHCVVTSPPYWNLRAYTGDPGMIGMEPTMHEHIAALVEVFREIRRVLRSDGTVWLNYGDAYASGNRSTYDANVHNLGHNAINGLKRPKTPKGLKPKDLLMLNSRVALAMQDDGWWVRSEIIWHKPNPAPGSYKDRPTSAHEKLFLMTKAKHYFYDYFAVRTKPSEETKLLSYETMDFDRRDLYRDGVGRQKRIEKKAYGDHRRGFEKSWDNMTKEEQQSHGANLRDVWTIPPDNFKESHYAVFPPALVEPCIKAGTSEHGVCRECGTPWERVLERVPTGYDGSRYGEAADRNKPRPRGTAKSTLGSAKGQGVAFIRSVGWEPGCDHDAPYPVAATVLDPFGGAGTVGLVATRLYRDAILIEISRDYADMSERRIRADFPPLTQSLAPIEIIS